jgi:hypothetical protein
MLHVVTSFFRVRRIPGSLLMSVDEGLGQRTQREAEYISCILHNAISPHVAKVHLLVQDPESMEALHRELLRAPPSALPAPSFSHHLLPQSGPCSFADLRKKIVPTLALCHPAQPHYSHLFDYCDRMLHGQLCMVCNADIYVPRASQMGHVTKLFQCAKRRSVAVALALTRYETDGSDSELRGDSNSIWECPLINDYRGSHDAFVFQSPLGRAFASSVQHPQNCYKAENIVIHELEHRAKCLVLNPSRSVRIVHLHHADIRQWLPPVDEQRYGRAVPMTAEQALSAIEAHSSARP